MNNRSNSFNARATLSVNGKDYEIYRLDAVKGAERLPYSLKILLENLLRHDDGINITADDIKTMANWDAKATPSKEISFTPARVLMQDFTGVPAVVDLAAMRDAMKKLGGDPQKINPLSPAELVIDHSVQIDAYGSADAEQINADKEYSRNQERYSFLKWGQKGFSNFKVVPPDTGIVHQVNLEFLARTVFAMENNGVLQAYPDTLVGTDSHTTMVNGLGVLGWGVGGIEAEAAMLGQPVSMLIPQVVGFKLTGRIPEGATATDLVLTVVEILRKHGVVGKFVEFFGDGLDQLSLADRATLANMAPEYGATCGIFPIDDETLNYLRLSGRDEDQIKLVEAYAREQGLFRLPNQPQAEYSSIVELDMSSIEPSLAGPKRPQDRVPLKQSKVMFNDALQALSKERKITSKTATAVIQGKNYSLDDGAVVIASITSCTNTSNPSVMLGAALVAKKAVALGMKAKPWVKTSLAPGSRAVTEYLKQANLLGDMEALGFNVVGYGCATCIGNSGPLLEPVSKAIVDGDLSACSVLSGNRNFEGRVHAEVRMNYLASPPLVVAYALAGTMNIDLYSEALGQDRNGNDVYLKDIWPSLKEVQDVVNTSLKRESYVNAYDDVYKGEDRWIDLASPEGQLFDWQDDSTYIKNPPYFEGMSKEAGEIPVIRNARALALLGDSVTTDHISPAGAIKANSPAGKYLQEHGVAPIDFNSLGSRRGNHEVMMRGTFANIRLRNLLAPGTEGGVTLHLPEGEQMSIYDAAMKYKAEGTQLIVIAGKEYGSGSSRDWAAKGPRLLGIRAVIAESYERIHRSNLVGMGILPLQFKAGNTAESLGLTGRESFSIDGLGDGTAKEVTVTTTDESGKSKTFTALVRIDTPKEVDYYRHGGILHYVLRQLAS
ncbi:MAG: aconitate hydratase AcnA [Gammaproteobacteria bacterium]|nr:aconitate hydratase AcnA [Gammaproteobacteria bacterium]